MCGRADRATPQSPLLLLQCIVQLLQAFEEQLLKAEPDVVLSFVNFSLQDTASAEHPQDGVQEQRPLIVPMSANQADGPSLSGGVDEHAFPDVEHEDGKISKIPTQLVSAALDLLLALLEGQLSETAIVHLLSR